MRQHKIADYRDLDRNVARTRIFLSLVGFASIFVDPTIGEPFALEMHMLEILLAHVAYGIAAYVYVRRSAVTGRFLVTTAALDVAFATAISLLTQGPTTPGQIFFAFAIMAVGCRAGFRATLFVTAYGILLYAPLIVVSPPDERWAYVMRPIYLAIMGYLLSFLGEQRSSFEVRLRKLETIAERHTIARALHDGYLQALATVNLRLKTWRALFAGGRTAEAESELAALEAGITREYDEIRSYVRSLAEVEDPARDDAAPADVADPRVRLDAAITGSAATVEQVLQIMLEGLRNARRHGRAAEAAIRAATAADRVRITIDDDGVGLPETATPPWSIASRVAESRGRLVLARDERRGAHLEIELPMP